MIITVTPNTSIDKAYTITSVLERGCVSRVARVLDNAGGKGLNASRAVKTCNEEICATGFVGGNNGRMLCEILASQGIAEKFVRVANETRCCINVLEPDGTSTELLEPGRFVSNEEAAALKETVAQLACGADVVTINGSVPAGCDASLYRELIASIKAAGKPVILDTSGTLLIESLDAAPTMIKPNTDEIAQILGRKVSGLDEVVEAARELHDKYGIAQVVVSLGSKGAVLVCDEGAWRAIPPKIEVVNPVGSGDTMVGAFAVAMARGMKPDQQLAFASACATANCLTAQTGSFEYETALEVMKNTKVEAL